MFKKILFSIFSVLSLSFSGLALANGLYLDNQTTQNLYEVQYITHYSDNSTEKANFYLFYPGFGLESSQSDHLKSLLNSGKKQLPVTFTAKVKYLVSFIPLGYETVDCPVINITTGSDDELNQHFVLRPALAPINANVLPRAVCSVVNNT